MRNDLILNDDFDLSIANGDLIVDESDAQHAQLIAMTSPLNWRPVPHLGVNAIQFVKGPSSQVEALKKALRLNLELDGYKLKNVDFSNGLENFTITTEAII